MEIQYLRKLKYLLEKTQCRVFFILNSQKDELSQSCKVQRYTRFKYSKIESILNPDGSYQRFIAHIEPRVNSKASCSACGKPCPGYDSKPDPRLFQFVPLFNVPLYFSYVMRRVQCSHCGGVKTESVPWASGKHQTCEVFRKFLASWAKRLSWKDTATSFDTSWDTVYRSTGLFSGLSTMA